MKIERNDCTLLIQIASLLVMFFCILKLLFWKSSDYNIEMIVLSILMTSLVLYFINARVLILNGKIILKNIYGQIMKEISVNEIEKRNIHVHWSGYFYIHYIVLLMKDGSKHTINTILFTKKGYHKLLEKLKEKKRTKNG